MAGETVNRGLVWPYLGEAMVQENERWDEDTWTIEIAPRSRLPSSRLLEYAVCRSKHSSGGQYVTGSIASENPPHFVKHAIRA